MTYSIERHTLTLSDGFELLYSIFRGANESAQASPLLICLHPGWSGELPSKHYGEQFLSSMFMPAFSKTPATLLAPDCPARAWNNPGALDAIIELLDHIQKSFAFDSKKVSLVGYSAGGWGAWYFLQRFPDIFSSAIMLETFPVVEPATELMDNFLRIDELLSSRLDELVQKTPQIPIYIIHSQDDEVMPNAKVMQLYQVLSENNPHLELDLIKGVGHYDGEGYIAALSQAALWLKETWGIA